MYMKEPFEAEAPEPSKNPALKGIPHVVAREGLERSECV